MKNILFADDNKHIREYCKSELEAAGYRVFVACDGRAAVAAVQNGQVDLAILDIHMPVMDGYEAAERIQAISPSMPIVFFTGEEQRFGAAPRGTAPFCSEDSTKGDSPHAPKTPQKEKVPERVRVAKSDDLADLKLIISRLLNGL